VAFNQWTFGASWLVTFVAEYCGTGTDLGIGRQPFFYSAMAGIIFAGSALGIGLGLLIFNPELDWYVGLSGVLHGLLVAGAIIEVRRDRLSGYALLILIAATLLWEQIAGPLPWSGVTAGGTVIIHAHLYGGLCGDFVWRIV